MKHLLFVLVTIVATVFMACKSEKKATDVLENKVEERKENPSNQKVVTVNNTDNIKVEIKESENVKASPQKTKAISEDQVKNGSSESAEELVRKAINTKPTARVETNPDKSITKTQEKPVKKPKPNPVKSAPIKYLPKIEFDEMSYDFGEITEGDIVKHNFTFTNVGKTKLSIEKATASCGCTKPSFPFIDIQPGETGYIGVTYNSVSKEGPQKPTITVYSNAHPNQMTLHLNGIVNSKPKEEEKEENASMEQDTTKN